MKALNNTEIYKRYWTFIIYFSLLLALTVLCRLLYLKTYDKYAEVLAAKKEKTEFIMKKRLELSSRIDSLTLFMQMLNTKQVKNEAALERAILRIKYDTVNELEGLEAEGIKDFGFYRRVIANVEMMLDAKKTLSQSLLEEEVNKKKLLECKQANTKLKNRTF